MRLAAATAVFIALALAFSAALLSSETPARPSLKSEHGYLQLSSDLELKPKAERVFVQPLNKLLVFEELPDAWLLVLLDSSGSSLLRMPKIPKYVLQLRFDDSETFAQLRSAMELECLPWKLAKGEELPLAAAPEQGKPWLVFRFKGAQRYCVAVPSASRGVAFSKASCFELFAREQEAKGLALHDGEWIPKERADALARERKAAEAAKDSSYERLRSMAQAGHLVMADFSVLDGKFRGGDGERVLFESVSGSSRWIAPSELADVSLETALAMGVLKEARDALDDATARLKKSEFAEAAAALAAASAKKVPKDAKLKSDSAAKFALDLAAAKSALKKALSERGLALHDGAAFPQASLAAHLALGHVYLKRQAVWLTPSQLCARCSGAGDIACALCNGAGVKRYACARCSGSGQIPCELCDGSGVRRCQVCGGNGFTTRTCRVCGGSGYVMSYSTLLQSGGPSVYSTPNGSIVRIPPPPMWGVVGDYVQTVCSRCNGAGYEKSACSACAGKGWVECPKTRKCPACDGHGAIGVKCQACSGLGRIQCPDCAGKGYSGEPQTDGLTAPAKKDDAPGASTLSRQLPAPL